MMWFASNVASKIKLIVKNMKALTWLNNQNDCHINPTRDVDKKQMALGIGKGREGDPNTMNLKFVEFN